MSALQQELNSQQHYGWGFTIVTVAILFFLPQYLPPLYGNMLMGFGSAAMLTIFLFLCPESLRSRRGSLNAARYLVATLWLLAAASTAVLFIG